MVRLVAKTVLLMLFLLLAAPPLQAAELTAPAPWGFFGELWTLVANAWGDNGCEVDPSGRCAPRQSTATLDNGCEMDPNGRCHG